MRPTAACQTPGMPDAEAMLAAHVRFELNRWTEDGFKQTVREEVEAAFAWLDSIRLDDVLSAAEIGDWVQSYVVDGPASDEMVAVAVRTARSAHTAALRDETLLGDLLPAECYDQLARTVIGMEELREVLTAQITTSEVYSRLISHVLYQGIKNYIQNENVIARKVPGASALMRMGQNAISTAAPKLEQTIDRQLTAFVNANIADSIRESKRYLDKIVDAKLLKAVADELWDTNAKSSVADLAGLVPPAAIDEFAQAGRAAWLHVRATPAFTDLAAQVVGDFLDEHGRESIAALLGEAGLSPATVCGLLTDLGSPFVAKAVEDGYLQARIRARLEPFYASYFATA